MSSEYNGITLNKLVVEIRNMLADSDDRDLFMAKVALQGYEYHNYYDDFVYEKIYRKNYSVTKDFPRLTPKDVPKSVVKAIYDIQLNEIAEFEVEN